MILIGDVIEKLKTLDDASIHCCVTSPPYWGLRDYGTEGQLGLERTPQEYVEKMVAVFREVRRVLRDDATLWLNLGDCYQSGSRGGYHRARAGVSKNYGHTGSYNDFVGAPNRFPQDGLKDKDLVGIPWRVAFALQADGWYLRQDIIWHKPNPMPESVTDRCTKAHEYIFLLSKSRWYYFDAEAIKEPASLGTHQRISQDLANQVGSFRANGGNKTNGPMKAVIAGSTRKIAEAGSGIANNRSYEAARALKVETVNKRSVWTVGTKPFPGAHFATFPPDLIEPCILAGCPRGGMVLDPFFGAGTVGIVALKHGREYIGIELNPDYAEMAENRIKYGTVDEEEVRIEKSQNMLFE